MPSKVHCPFHEDNTESLTIYEDHLHCYGCGKHGPLSLISDTMLSTLPPNKKIVTNGAPENVGKSVARIHALPTKEIRGLTLHYDEAGYYILWPNAQYYKKRLWGVEKGNKYRCPFGVSKPPFIAFKGITDTVIIVEGELNASTLHKYHTTGHAIISAGSCSELTKYMSTYLQYKRFIVIVDKDAPGVVGAIALRELLLKHTKYVTIHSMEIDFNDLLVKHGKEAFNDAARQMEL